MNFLIAKTVNRHVDKFVRPAVGLFNHELSAYQVCGSIGFTLAVLQCVFLVLYAELSFGVLTGIMGISILTFLGLAMATKIITSEEQLIYYHHEIAIIIMVTIVLKITNQPVLYYLDITILGIGTFLILGRVGCLMVGCCHGRPYKCGICYRKEHVAAGFTHYYQGVRLFPIQAVESVWVLFIVITGSAFVITRQPPGQVFVWYVVSYDIGRFIFEFARGDPERPYFQGFSEGQWISVILMCAVVGGEVAGILPFHIWHIFATAAMISAMITVASARRIRKSDRHKVLNPRHIKEFNEAMEQVTGTIAEGTTISTENPWPEVIPVGCTSLGIQISAGQIKDTEASIDHYTLSSDTGTLSREMAGILADLIIQLKHPSSPKKLIDNNRGIFHVLIQTQTTGGSI